MKGLQSTNRLGVKVQHREYSSQRTQMHDTWTRILVWGWPEGVGVGTKWKGGSGKNWDNCNSKNNKT